MEQKQLKDLKKGEFFRLVESETAPVWVKGQRISRKGHIIRRRGRHLPLKGKAERRARA